MRKKAMLWEKLEGGSVQCRLCAHRCRIEDDDFGFCGMRQNLKGTLYTHAYGKVIAGHLDPIEKKPLYHFLPGTQTFSVATIGCNFSCSFCQNWTISQVSARNESVDGYKRSPEELIKDAVDNNCRSIAYTYTEPTVFFEYAYDTARLARKKGIKNIFVTNGYMTKEAVKEISPFLDAANIDLKFFSDELYKKMCGGSLKPVLDTIKNMKDEGIWVEVTTLIVPGQNDSEEDLRGIARTIAAIGKEIPWHISRFHPDYKFTDAHDTPMDAMKRAGKIGAEEGLKYVYLGNVSAGGDTVCPECGRMLIGREGFHLIVTEDMAKDGKCSKCGASIEGVWE